MLKRNAILAAAVASVAAGLSSTATLAVPPTVDGTRDAIYGSPFAEQTVNTQFGDNFSELDAGYSYIENGKLHLFIAGNLESNYNKLAFFFDTRGGGQNVVLGNNPYFELNEKYVGMTFDSGFEADYFLTLDRDVNNAYLKFSEMNTGGGGFGGDLGSVATPNPNQQGSGIVGGANGFPLVEFGYDNSNTGGVIAGSDAATPGAGASVTTGAEITIDLMALGATENFKLMVLVNGNESTYLSNQFLAGLAPPQGNLGADGFGGGGTNLSLINLNAFTGNQYSTILYSAPLSEWNSGNGSWTEGAKWTGDGVPDARDARAVLGTLGGAGAKVITLDTNVELQSLTFDNPGGYTIQPSGANVLTIAGNAAVDTVRVVTGNHTINAPLVLGATTAFGVDANASITVSDLTATGQVVVKRGAGLASFNRVQGTGLDVGAGTVSILSNGTNTGLSVLGFLNIAGGETPTAALDLNNNDLIIRNRDANTVVPLVKSARGTGGWTGQGITSSAARTASPANKTIGVLSGIEYNDLYDPTGRQALFDGVVVNDPDSVLKFTYYGDTDFSGLINFDDYSRTDAGFLQGRTGWLNGDFNYDNIVNFDDYALIDAAFLSQSGTLGPALRWIGGDGGVDMGSDPSLAFVEQHYQQFGGSYANALVSAVPEPSSALVVGGLAAAVAGIRRRRRSGGRGANL